MKQQAEEATSRQKTRQVAKSREKRDMSHVSPHVDVDKNKNKNSAPQFVLPEVSAPGVTALPMSPES
jgi:hypothetical protein